MECLTFYSPILCWKTPLYILLHFMFLHLYILYILQIYLVQPYFTFCCTLRFLVQHIVAMLKLMCLSSSLTQDDSKRLPLNLWQKSLTRTLLLLAKHFILTFVTSTCLLPKLFNLFTLNMFSIITFSRDHSCNVDNTSGLQWSMLWQIDNVVHLIRNVWGPHALLP